MGEYVVGSTEMTLENRDFLRSVSIDADDGMAMFDSITSAFRFCFSLGISLNAREEPKGETTSVAPRQFLPEDYLDSLLPISKTEDISLGAAATQFGHAGIEILKKHIENNPDGTLSSILEEDITR